MQFYQRNPRRFTPRDFDYSAYFDIIKYPYIDLDNTAVYQQLPWNDDGVICNGPNDCFIPKGHPAALNGTDATQSNGKLKQRSRTPRLNLLSRRVQRSKVANITAEAEAS